MFPDITGQQRFIRAGQRGGGIGGADQCQTAVGALYQPGPTGTEGADGGFGEFGFERIETAERGIDGFGQFTGRSAAAVGLQAVPVEGVVPDLGGVVEQAALRFAHDGFQIGGFEFGAGNQVVQIGDVGLVVLGIMEIDGFRRDVRFQCGAVVGQGGQFNGHGGSLRRA